MTDNKKPASADRVADMDLDHEDEAILDSVFDDLHDQDLSPREQATNKVPEDHIKEVASKYSGQI